MQDQIQKWYFKKDGIIYIVKPELVSDADGELEFDIIDDFQDLFTQVKDIFESEENLIEIDIDKQDELTRILARLRWFECIFRNNPWYIKEPRICRGKLRK